MNNKYHFEFNYENINLSKLLNNYDIGDLKKPLIIYIKDNNEKHLKVRCKKPFDYYIDYNNIIEDAYINIAINLPTNKKSELKNVLENIKNYIELNINIEENNIEINSVYYETLKRPNIITFYCDFIPERNSGKHCIFQIKEYLTKNLWNSEKFNFKLAEKGYTDLLTFKNKLINANKLNKKLNIFPDFEPILKVEDRFDKIKNKYKRYITLKYNIRQIFFVDLEVKPKPIF